MNKGLTAVLCSLLLLTACNSGSQNSNATKAEAPKNYQTGPEITMGVRQLLNQQVCMVNDRFMGKDQIPINTSNKIYYGCCEGCVEALKKDDTHHFGTDPVTGHQVDKATAVIILEPGSSDEVVYFNSKETAKTYIEQKEKK